jgi:hypothetical protein
MITHHHQWVRTTYTDSLELIVHSSCANLPHFLHGTCTLFPLDSVVKISHPKLVGLAYASVMMISDPFYLQN